MLRTLGLLLGCQLAGEFIARGLGLPIPGPVLGLVILLAALALRPPLASALRPTTQVILAHLSLMVANGKYLLTTGCAIESLQKTIPSCYGVTWISIRCANFQAISPRSRVDNST